MSKVVKITEGQLIKIIDNVKEKQRINEELDNQINEEIEEGLRTIWDKMKEPFQKIKYGIKGLKSGTGIKFLPFVVMIRNILRQLKRLDEPNERVMLKLKNLETRIQGVYLKDDLKNDLLYGVNNIQESFRTYAKAIDDMEILLSKTLNVDPSAINKSRPASSSNSTSNNPSPTSSSTTITPPTNVADYIKMVRQRGYREGNDYNELRKLGMRSMDINKALKGIPFKRP